MCIKDASFSSKFTAAADTVKAGSWPNRNARFAVLILLLPILGIAGCGGGYPNPTQTSNALVAIFVNASFLPSIAPGETIQFGASGGYPSSSSPGGISYKNITKSATWSTSNAAVATVDKGLVTGTGAGSVTITATLGGQTGSATAVVGLSSTIAITPTGADPFSKSATPEQQFIAQATYSDGTVLDVTDFGRWSSNPTGIVKFYSYFPGDAAFVATGTTTITATFGTGEAPTVTLTVVP
jgi:hypothetical protein